MITEINLNGELFKIGDSTNYGVIKSFFNNGGDFFATLENKKLIGNFIVSRVHILKHDS